MTNNKHSFTHSEHTSPFKEIGDLNSMSKDELIRIVTEHEETLNINAIKESTRIIRHEKEVYDLKQKLALVIRELKTPQKKNKKDNDYCEIS